MTEYKMYVLCPYCKGQNSVLTDVGTYTCLYCTREFIILNKVAITMEEYYMKRTKEEKNTEFVKEYGGKLKTIKDHSGNKYIRTIRSCINNDTIQVDCYAIINACEIKDPAIQHALKKLLYSGIRGKGDLIQDLTEAQDAISRAIEEAKKNCNGFINPVSSDNEEIEEKVDEFMAEQQIEIDELHEMLKRANDTIVNKDHVLQELGNQIEELNKRIENIRYAVDNPTGIPFNYNA